MNSVKHTVTDRMIQKTLGHRNPLYREAAHLLLLYRRIMNKFDEEVVQQLLRETFVYPEKEDVLFELYWVMKLIKANAEKAELQLIDGKRNLVASWSDEYDYHIYHDSTGSKELQFSISTEEVRETYHPYIKKKVDSMKRSADLASTFFERNVESKTFWSGRPDILIEVYEKETGELQKVVIGEVKHTKNVDYAMKGLRELVDYMELVKGRDGEYLNERDDLEMEGMLFVGDMEVEKEKRQGVSVVSVRDVGCEVEGTGKGKTGSLSGLKDGDAHLVNRKGRSN
ncbi:hypothetical protein [Halalkalibacter wakoensis]|uniref:hypothetical protein n=1 Tax=Halalkalibacter wakoensis TaxID=127891 RepID=UPI001A7EFF4D|nr:hypothetical protein [Halalkalibacter wakoensis]